MMKLRANWHTVLLIGIVALAAFMRLYQLDSLPPGLHPDEAANGLDIFRMFDNGDIRPLYNTNGPRESLFFFLQAIFVGILGNTILALRLAPAIITTVAVIFVYLWARDWFGRQAGLIAAFLMAITPWAIHIGRDGFRASMLELFVPLTLWLYTKAFQTGSRRWFLAAGAALGLGGYTYLAWRLFPLALIAFVIFIAISRRSFIVKWWRPVALSLVASLVVLLPMIIFGLQHPEDVNGRTAGTSVLNPSLNHGKPLQTLADSVVKTAGMFNFHGDENYRHNLGGQPQLNIFVGAMFVLGILICLRYFGRPRYFLLLVVLGVMLLPAALTAEGIPHALRAIGALPPAIVLSAIGISYMIGQWYRVFPINSVVRTSGLAAILLLLGLSGYQGYAQYFVAWAHSPETFKAYSSDSVAMANYMNDNKFTGKRYAIIDGYSNITVLYLTHERSQYDRLEIKKIDSLPLVKTPQQFVIAAGPKHEAVKKLRIKYPKGQLAPHYGTTATDQTELFLVYTVQP